MTMVVALSCSSRWEIMEAMRRSLKDAMADGKKSYDAIAGELTEENFAKHLETNFMPDPDLLSVRAVNCASAIISCGR